MKNINDEKESSYEVKKTARKKRSQQEQTYIDQAKKALMEQKSMSEEEAFRYLQKCSMDSGRSMVETAQMILLMMDAAVFTQ